MGMLHQLGETQDSIQRGAQFVAHVGEKQTLGPIGRFGTVAGLFQFRSAFLYPLFQPLVEGEQLLLLRLQLCRHLIKCVRHAAQLIILLPTLQRHKVSAGYGFDPMQ